MPALHTGQSLCNKHPRCINASALNVSMSAYRTGRSRCVSKVGVGTNEGLDLVVQLNQQPDVLDTILLHLTSCSGIAGIYSLPKIEAFMLNLLAKPEKRANEGKAVHKVPHLLDRLDDVNTGDRG